MITNPLEGLPLGPVIEPAHAEAVITGKSHDLLKNGQFNRVPIMIGHTSLEAHSNDGLSCKYICRYRTTCVIEFVFEYIPCISKIICMLM